MQQFDVHILCTRPIEQSLIETAANKRIDIEVVSFIETEPLQTIEVQQEIEQALLQSATVIFTSGNAVEAVATELEGHDPEWEIFCLGNTTRELVSKYFGEQHISGIADNAIELAEIVATASDSDEVIFFCGDQRRQELPDSLREKGIEVEEIVVYQTIALPRKLEKKYEAILFFSPTAVRSFFEFNIADPKAIFFSIGNTTASEIRKYSKNKVMISDEPSKERMVEMVVEYFT